MSDWLIMGKYPFKLLPGEETNIRGTGARSYYEYLNGRPLETGKNVLCAAWVLEKFSVPNPVVEDPFGGCGVFSVFIQENFQPSVHRIFDIDPQCVKQLHHALDQYPGTLILQGDARELAGSEKADLYICEIPFFTYTRYTFSNEWRWELHKMTQHRPAALLITDGSSCKFHFVRASLAERGIVVTDRESYVRLMSQRLWDTLGYSVTRCAYHNTCFYYLVEPLPPGDIDFKFLPAGTGSEGLRKVSE